MKIIPLGLLGLMAMLPASAIEYPETKTVDHQDNYHGTAVADPYRWLEDDVRESKDVHGWVASQNVVAQAYLAGIPNRDRVGSKLRELWNYERYGISPPRHEEYFFLRKGDRYFSFRNDGLQNQSLLYVQDTPEQTPRVLIDPNQWSEDGTKALASFVPSPSGTYVAYGIQDSGSDWRTWKVVSAADGKMLTDQLNWLKFTGISWLPDESGFFYSRYPQPEAGQEFQSLNKNQKVFFHKLGTPESEDSLVYARADQPDWGFDA